MERRDFIRNSVLVSGGVLVSNSLLCQIGSGKKKRKVTVLHTNDTHSNIDPFPENHVKFPNRGGVARRFERIQKIREEEENVLVLDAGDFFQGTPYFNKFGGVLEMKLMSEMGYDAATLGNHDFDGGMDGFLKAKQFANFPFLCSNYDFSNTLLSGETSKNTIIQKGEVKIGLFGLGIELEGLVPRDKYGNTVYLDPVESANTQALELKMAGCDLIICLSHLGYEYTTDKVSDKILASKTNNIHLIIGGHTHTFLDEPAVVRNLDGELVLINQVGWGGINLGRVDFEFESKLIVRNAVLKVEN
jgi:5'-nucleotidase